MLKESSKDPGEKHVLYCETCKMLIANEDHFLTHFLADDKNSCAEDKPNAVEERQPGVCLECGEVCQSYYKYCRLCYYANKPLKPCPRCGRLCRGRQCRQCHCEMFQCRVTTCRRRRWGKKQFCQLHSEAMNQVRYYYDRANH